VCVRSVCDFTAKQFWDYHHPEYPRIFHFLQQRFQSPKKKFFKSPQNFLFFSFVERKKEKNEHKKFSINGNKIIIATTKREKKKTKFSNNNIFGSSQYGMRAGRLTLSVRGEIPPHLIRILYKEKKNKHFFFLKILLFLI
jgi:hypothetical protein